MAWYGLFLVTMTVAMSLLDRQILAILAPRIKADLNIGDAEMGVLYGAVFGLFYSVFSLPLGRLADGWVRTRLLSLSIFGWSIMTGLAGFANSFGMLALSRLGVGIGEASSQPAGMSLLSDYFPKKQRGMVTSAMAVAVALGLGGAIGLGALIADWWENAFADGGAPLGLKGWQAAFVIAASPGFLLSFLLLKLPEPLRGAGDGVFSKPDPAPFRASLDTLVGILPGFAWVEFARRKAPVKIWIVNIIAAVVIASLAVFLAHWTDSLRPDNPIALRIGALELTGNALQWTISGAGAYIVICWMQSLALRDRPAFSIIVKQPAIAMIIAVAALQSVINYGVMSWSAVYAIQNFEGAQTTIAVQFSILITVLGITGPLIAGLASDWMNQRFKGGRIYLALFALGVSPFLAFAVFKAPTLGGFFSWFVVYSLVLTMWIPPIYASMLDLVLPRMRGMIMSYYILMMTITGMGLGPYAVGMISDVNEGNLGDAILNVYWVAPAIITLLVALVWRLPKDEAMLAERAREAGEPV
ncbi:MFS transporter [Marinicaulis flavus]|uniref:MFS transporter n=2 Tax=Hyphococcus luteus TaxID=2058213 RepID=A0A2S7K3B0_9PROT|nr:MFS transporter [Marinicaulis flavus]